MEALKKLLAEECHYRLRDEIMDRFLDMMTEVRLKVNEPIISYGELNSDVYILKEGIIRLIYFDGINERTHAFALAGTMVMSHHSYFMRYPAFLQVEACIESTVMKISKRAFDDLMEESHEFSRWVADMALSQLYSYEMKLSVINGTTAKERFVSLAKSRPMIMEKVSLKIIASYLGITPQYLSMLKQQFSLLKEE